MNKRLQQFIEYLKISVREFEIKTGISNGIIGNVINKNTTMRTDTVAKICETYRELSIEWLLTGCGSMIKTENSEQSTNIEQSINQPITNMQQTNGNNSVTMNQSCPSSQQNIESLLQNLTIAIQNLTQTIQNLPSKE